MHLLITLPRGDDDIRGDRSVTELEGALSRKQTSIQYFLDQCTRAGGGDACQGEHGEPKLAE
jgi:hypothetical protein